MKQILLFLFVLCTLSVTAQRAVTVNDKNGDNRVSVADVTYTIDSIKSHAASNVRGVVQAAKRALEKRNVLVLWQSSGKQVRYYFEDKPVIEYVEDEIVVKDSVGNDWDRYRSDDVLKITYDYILRQIHEYVDLGLPSGTLWATCNVGAESPEEFGDYFAWGEVKPKDIYSWNTYIHCDGSNTTMTKYCLDSAYGTVDGKGELEPEDDAAYVNWGPEWRIPSKEQVDELYNSQYTTTTWTTKNGVYGRRITSNSNGASIFLPASGQRFGNELFENGECGYYSVRKLTTTISSSSFALFIKPTEIGNYYSYYRYFGLSVRPVRQKQQ